MKMDVVRFCKNHHTSEVEGKPNQVVPLASIPAIGKPFKHIIVHCAWPIAKNQGW